MTYYPLLTTPSNNRYRFPGHGLSRLRAVLRGCKYRPPCPQVDKPPHLHTANRISFALS
jgi:hypothetical protein